jgi:hypothetical protein
MLWIEVRVLGWKADWVAEPDSIVNVLNKIRQVGYASKNLKYSLSLW